MKKSQGLPSEAKFGPVSSTSDGGHSIYDSILASRYLSLSKVCRIVSGHESNGFGNELTPYFGGSFSIISTPIVGSQQILIAKT